MPFPGWVGEAVRSVMVGELRAARAASDSGRRPAHSQVYN